MDIELGAYDLLFNQNLENYFAEYREGEYTVLSISIKDDNKCLLPKK